MQSSNVTVLEELLAIYGPGDPEPDPDQGDPPGRPSLGQQFASATHERLWPITVLFATMASLATVTSAVGRLIRDNRLEQFSNPVRRVAKTLSIWDGSRGLGRVREDFWPGTTGPLAVLRGLGLPTVLSQKLWHALVLVILGVGTVAVLRLFRPRIGMEHVLAGLAVMFGAYSASFLVPSNLSFQVALAPWMVVALWRGVTEDRPWRWAAVFALVVFAAGNTDVPGLIYCMVPLLPVSIYLVVIERSVRLRDLVGWLARAGLLCVLISAASLAKTSISAANFDQRLAETESPRVSSVTSSWSESFRGLGNWLSYFRQLGAMQKPQGEPYFTNPVVILATFVPPIVAAMVLWRSRWRARVLFAWMIVCSLVIMVEAFPLAKPSPLGGLLLDLMSNVASLRAFRNIYKSGAGLAMGVAILFGVGIEAASRWAGRWREVVVIAGLGVLLATGVPFWTGRLYDSDRTSGAVPAYWTQAFSYLDAQPADTRVLILPSSSRTHYRWGWLGDDIFDAMLTRDHAVATGIPLSGPLASNLLESISDNAAEPTYRAGTMAPMLRRLGISEVVVRNDLDWQDMGRPRPALYAALRADPDLHRVATFGDPGQNTTDARDTTADASVERNLPPVEIYRIDGTPNELRAASVAPSLLVSGDGFGWPGLAAAGMLNGTAPVEYTGGLDNAGLQAGFENGSPLAVTDSNRRRLRLLVEYDPDYSYLLGDGQDLDRQAQTLFPQPGSQSVAWYPDAVSLSLSGNPRTTLGSEPWNRPANAFDADPGTSWIMRRAQEPNGRTFRIDLRKPSTVDHIKVALAPGITPSSGATQLKLGFSSGPDVLVNITDPVTDLAFPAHETDFITIQIIAVAPNSQSVGFSDITFPGLDLREFVQAPSDVVDRALDDDALAAALMRAPVTYLFSRDTTTAVPAAVPDATAVDHAPTNEVSLRRRFESLGSRPYALDGSLHLGARSSDEQIAAIIGPAAKASATARAGESLAGWGGYAADGDPNTSWIAPAVSSPSVTVSVPPRVLTSVEVSTISDDTAARVKTVEVTVGDLTRTLDLDTSGCASPDQTCKPTGRLLLDTRPTAGEVKVTVKAVDTAGRAQRKQVKIAEVQVNEVANEALDLGAPISTECRPLGLSVDALPVPVRISGTVADVLASRPLPWTACSAVDLGAGWHVTDTMTEVLFDRIRLVTTDVPPTRPAPTAAPTVQVVSQSGNLIHLRLDGAGPSTLWLGQSFDLRWLASVDGATPVVATPLDTQSGWAIPGGSHDVVLRFRPAHLFNISLLVTGSAVVVCLWLALRRRRPHPEPPRPAPGW